MFVQVNIYIYIYLNFAVRSCSVILIVVGSNSLFALSVCAAIVDRCSR